jgi:hypothetical protein
MGIGKNSDMVEKIPTWWEKFRHGGKNSDMVGKILTWWEKSQHGGKNSSLEMGHGG